MRGPNDVKASSTSAVAPPRPRLAVTMGVTGHRAARLETAAHLDARIAEIVAAIGDAVRALDGAPWFSSESADLRVLSALADGADQRVADTALAAGFALDAVLPFTAADYAEDFDAPEARAAFERLSAAASRTLVLPGDRASSARAYALAGQALIAHSTILLAVWDGEPALGRGGTAEVVAHAIETGVPVIRVPLDANEPVHLLWSGFEPFALVTRDAGHSSTRDWSPETLKALLEKLLLPPADATERRHLRRYLGEGERLRHWRIEYALLLAVTGVKRLGRNVWRKTPYRTATARDWLAYRDAAAHLSGTNAPALDTLETAYSWADNLATHFAQDLRSGHVVNFIFAALAVLVALSGLIFTHTKLALVTIEVALIVIVILNTRAGVRGEWQRRWLDYRILAERLRPMRSLKLLGVASPPRPPARKRTGNRRWVDWYVTATWRAMGMPAGSLDPERQAAAQALVATHELGTEIAYHRSNAHQMAHLEHQLHRVGGAAFVLTIILSGVFVLLYFATGMPPELSRWFIVASAGLPAIGGATYALRVHGDFAGNAGRSAETADELELIRAALAEPGLPLARAAALATAAARVMLVDLGEWRLTYEQRALAIPG